MKGCIIAGVNSGAGKTTITAAVMHLLTAQGLNIAPFKVGPDYIDPKFHEAVTGNKSCNLDSWMLDENTVRYLFNRHAAGYDMAIVEGVMGLYDGCGTRLTGSTADVARILDLPVILVVNVRGMSTSLAAIINGFVNFAPGVRMVGVILNNVSGQTHYDLLHAVIQQYCKVPCFGYFPARSDISLKSRHLGLVPVEELRGLSVTAERIAELAEKHIDISGLLDVAEIIIDEGPAVHESQKSRGTAEGLVVGIARDKAFNFYYEDNLSLMRDAGMRLVEFSPLTDEKLPGPVDAVYIGGGYPEVFGKELGGNISFREDILQKLSAGMPLYAECGGLMYLCESIICGDITMPMVGFLEYTSVMKERLQRFGYVELDFDGITTRAHEFHHSELNGSDASVSLVYSIRKAGRKSTWQCGVRKQNVLAGYPHVHFYSNPAFFEKIVRLLRGEL